MRILFVNRSYNQVIGGVERMMAVLMNDMCARGHDVCFMSFDPEDATSFYDLDSRIKWYKISIGDAEQKASITTKLKRALNVRKVFRAAKPDISIAFQDGPFRSTRIYTLGMNAPVIAAERNAPSRFDHTTSGTRRNITFQFFRLAKRVTIQCESYRNQYPAYLRSKIVTIPNPVAPANKFAAPKGNKGGEKILLSVGRLEYQKNFMVLLEAFAKIQNNYPSWKLVIVGEGSDRKKMEEFIAKHKLQDSIMLPGTTKDVASYYCKAHLFCLSSLWEGFPNVLAEAMSHGLPAVGFDNCSGVRDLISHNNNGLLAKGNNNSASLAKSLEELMKNDKLREEIGKENIKAMAEYSPKLIFDAWEKLFKGVAKK